ncbi:MAG TPA: hypothetical protein VF178_05750 [Gemmatimonadaceae bacterium]
MADPIYLYLDGHDHVLRPRQLILALGAFSKLLREIDAAVSGDPHGSVAWQIVSLSMSSPARIGYQALPRRRGADYSERVKREVVDGLALLSRGPERHPSYSDRALERTEQLARLRVTRQLADLRVARNGTEAAVGVTTLANIEKLRGPSYESLGSVVGRLDTIAVHDNWEFRIWSELTDRPVTCRFPPSMLERVKDALRKRVLVYGQIKWNGLGHPVLVTVDDFGPANTVREPTIEDVSGLIENLTDGESLRDHLDHLRDD